LRETVKALNEAMRDQRQTLRDMPR
jgi:hypothetical protein